MSGLQWSFTTALSEIVATRRNLYFLIKKRKINQKKKKNCHSLVPLSNTSESLSMSISKPYPTDFDQNHLIFPTSSLAVIGTIKSCFRPFLKSTWFYGVSRMDYEAGGMPMVSPKCFWPVLQ
jgi:hypothetical protein